MVSPRLLPLLVLLVLAAPSVLAQEAPLVTLSGVITDAASGDPIMGAGVVIPDLGIGAVSQRDGRFAIDNVPEGTHDVRVGAYRYHLDPTTEVVVEGDTAFDMALRPGAGVGCEVVHEHGEDGSHMTRDTDAR